MRLEGKVTVVTGSSRGIGRAVALGFAKEGAKITLNYYPSEGPKEPRTSREQAEKTLADIQSAGVDAILVEADVSQKGDVERLFGEARAAFGAVDVLVNNAGISAQLSWEDLDTASWDRVLDVNLRGAFLCSRAATPNMIEKGQGKIINVSSITFQLGIHRDAVHYISSKAGLVGLTRALARELGPYNIQVNTIAPGAIQTERELELFPDQEALAAYLYERQCLKRRGTPEDVVGAFIFLASAESDFVTGQMLNVDGGWAMH